MYEALMAAVVFFGIGMIIKNFTDFLLKRKIIKTGHIDKAGILEQQISPVITENQEVNKYPSLKWGLVALFAGIGFIVIYALSPSYNDWDASRSYMNSMLPFGIELVSISLGFITYFFIVNFSKKK